MNNSNDVGVVYYYRITCELNFIEPGVTTRKNPLNMIFIQIRSGKWVRMKDGKIETRIFTKSEPIYIGPKSCHDPKVFKSIFTGVGLRLRLNCSQDTDFDTAVDIFSRALAVSGFKYEKAKSELMKSNREEYLKEEKNRKQNKNKGKVFWISKYDPRIPHPREVLSSNYSWGPHSKENLRTEELGGWI